MDDLIRKAENYVAASNDHDIGRIRPMLAPECCYCSAGVGRHDGVDAIMAMMGSFFAANPDVHWQAKNYQQHSGHVVFDFVITLGGNSSSGVEEIDFDRAGAISRIVVQRYSLLSAGFAKPVSADGHAAFANVKLVGAPQ